MHSIKTILSNTGIKYLNLASNMISGEGIEILRDTLCKNTSIMSIDFGIIEGSLRKNSLGIQGAMNISAILIKNRSIE